MQWNVGPHLGARRKHRRIFGAVFEAWTKGQPNTNWCPPDHPWNVVGQGTGSTWIEELNAAEGVGRKTRARVEPQNSTLVVKRQIRGPGIVTPEMRSGLP